MGWKAAAGTHVGLSHIRNDVPCQDSVSYKIEGDTIYCAVSDGAGSASRAEEGSYHAVEAALKALMEEDWADRVPDECEVQPTFSHVFRKVVEKLQEVAKKEQCNFHDLSCTLLLYVVTPTYLAAAQIGDGFIVVRRLDHAIYGLVFVPDHGDFINTTTFVTCEDALDSMQVRVIDSPCDFVCASTDGLELAVIQYGSWELHVPFFRSLDNWAKTLDNSPPEETRDAIRSLLGRDGLHNANHHDDKGLLVCVLDRETLDNVTAPNSRPFADSQEVSKKYSAGLKHSNTRSSQDSTTKHRPSKGRDGIPT